MKQEIERVSSIFYELVIFSYHQLEKNVKELTQKNAAAATELAGVAEKLDSKTGVFKLPPFLTKYSSCCDFAAEVGCDSEDP